jgi:membrane protease YdiL (CAAX protease family)
MKIERTKRQVSGGGGIVLVNSLLTGPPRYVPRGPWHPAWALLVAIVIQAGLQFAAGMVGTFVAARVAGVPLEELTQQQLMPGVLAALLAAQLCVVGATWFAAGWFGGNRRGVLQIDGARPTVSEVIVALAGLALILGSYNLANYLLRPESFRADVQPFLPMLREPHWPLAAVSVGIGAPISEEFLFRGFLLSALAQWRLGFWPAALVINAVWTAFHAGYSAAGLIEVFIGGAYFSWLLWRSGSIWLSVICHAATNCTFLILVALLALH